MSNSLSHAAASRAAWILMLAAAGLLLITTGARQTLGLFIEPIHQDTGLSIVSISFALAVGQFVWGAVQPLFGALADQRGSRPVIVAGLLLLAAGLALASLSRSSWTLLLSLGLLSAAGAGAAGFSILVGATSANLPPERRSFAAGFINAGSSLGQFVYAPLAQALISAFGWVTALLAMAASALAGLPLVSRLGNAAPVAAAAGGVGLRAQLRLALRDRSYWLIHASFFSCGLHIAFLVTHLPGEVALCGLPAGVSATALALIGLFNVGGSIASGWLATTAPTAGLVGKLFGTRYLATLFGLTLLSHQTGAFFGAWLGGVTISRFGDYGWMWTADMLLAAIAALCCLPIREARVTRAVPVAA